MIKNINGSNKKLNIKKLIVAFVILFVIILIAVLCVLYFKLPAVRVFFDKYLFRKNITEDTLPYISTDSPYIYAFNNNILEQSENTLTFYNKHAIKETSLDIKIVNPIFKTNGNFFVIAEKNGQKVYLLHNKNIIWEQDIDGNISNVYVNKDGYVAVAISGTSYQTIIDLFSDDGSKLFRTYLSNSYVMDFTISPDSKFLALAESNLSGAVIKSNIKIIDISQASSNNGDAIIYQSESSNDLIVNLDYTKNNTLACIYDNHISIVRNNTMENVTTFDNSNILFADINDRIIQVEKKKDGVFNSSFELQIINTDTMERIDYMLNEEPKSIKVFGNVIAINFGREALFINNSAWLIKQYTAYHEIQDISVSNNVATIIFKNKVEFISL